MQCNVYSSSWKQCGLVCFDFSEQKRAVAPLFSPVFHSFISPSACHYTFLLLFSVLWLLNPSLFFSSHLVCVSVCVCVCVCGVVISYFSLSSLSPLPPVTTYSLSSSAFLGLSVFALRCQVVVFNFCLLDPFLLSLSICLSVCVSVS